MKKIVRKLMVLSIVGLLSSCNIFDFFDSSSSLTPSTSDTSTSDTSTSEATSTSEDTSTSTSETSSSTSEATSSSTSESTSISTSESTSIPTSVSTSELPSSSSLPSSSTSSTSEEPAEPILAFENVPTLANGDVLLEKLNASLTISLNGLETQKLTYNAFEQTSGLEFALYKDDELIDINLPLEENTQYKLIAIYDEMNAEVEFVTDSNLTRLQKENISMTYRSLSDYYSPATGETKVLMVPIKLTGSWTLEWKDEDLENFKDYIFGDGPLSFKSYYEDASFGAMNFSGLFSDIYEETTYTSDAIQSDSSMSNLLYTIRNAVNYIESNNPDIDFSEFDSDNNGCIDNIHLITNFSPDAYESETGNSAWNTPLWPHMSATGRVGTVSKPSANTYSLDDITHLRDSQAIAPIHEQGHIFGLSDYYDYNFTVDYVGSADMQSSNFFDWNSFSKFGVGWVSPYVVKDECTLTLNAASINGECLVVPAEYEEFNNSAFDEYFMIELFSRHGNNAKFYDDYQAYYPDANLDYGIRLYHVDARLFAVTGRETDDPERGYIGCDNNTYSYPYHYFPKLADYKLLCLIQRDGLDTFGDESDWWARRYMRQDDLFIEGDVFKFSEYSHFLSKQGNEKETMDDGLAFPYKIKFAKMDDEKVTIKITKDKSTAV